ncbi:hypothetical protein AMS68_007536 [Peltaster fructicola]|uniref:Carbohydrate-binding module family 19 domain-containing protein n=1 Tax=Peltaster fructicola TaxID=286661 RepID=A0A6H0Y5A9_9PEZI|nr:hypothetical protein AMS68_007536 [Peltaster fructicola]
MVYTLHNACLLATLALSWANLGSSHLIMKSPVPFGTDTLDNSPLKDVAIGSSGSDFPCKQRAGVYKISQMNNMAVGDSQTLSFTGSASHGGGTCQLAVSLDHEPTTNSTWKIIQVYEGGCPVASAGNSGTDTFTFKIPQNFPNGVATLAWTWYNRVGNREIYMNCAPITVTGGADNQDYYNTLPNMYIINLPSTQCGSVESSNQIIPNPGQYVLTGDTADKLASATGAACAAAAAAQTQGVQGYQAAAQSNGTATTTTSGAAMSAAVTASANNGQYVQSSAAASTSTSVVVPSSSQYSAVSGSAPLPQTASQSGFVTSTSLASALSSASDTSSSLQQSSYLPVVYSAVASSVATQAVVTQTLAMQTSTTQIAESSTPSSVASAVSGSNSCPQDGALLCNGPTQFGLCDHGQVVWQAVAAGTTCSNGAILKRSVSGREQQLGRWFRHRSLKPSAKSHP